MLELQISYVKFEYKDKFFSDKIGENIRRS